MRHFILAISCFTVLFTTSCKRNKISKTTAIDSVAVAGTPVAGTPVAGTPVAGIPVEVPSAGNTGTVTSATKVDVNPAEVDFRFLRIKSKVNYSSDNDSQSFPLTVHIEKDNKIWLSVAVGLEVARGLITRDSVIFLDRLHRNYYKYDFATLSKQFNFNLSYDLVQSILIGNMPVRKTENDEVLKQDGGFAIRQKQDFVQIENFIAEPTLKLQKLMASDATGTSKMQIDYGNFLAINNFLFPQEIMAKIEAPKDDKTAQTLINLQHNRIDFLDESPGFSFSIPKGYSPK